MNSSSSAASREPRENPGRSRAIAEVLIVSYGPATELAPLLQSLQAQTLRPSAVRIWHNGPEFPGPPGALSDGQNHGFGGGVDRLLSLVEDDIAVVVNPDCELDPRCLEELVAGMDGASCAAAALLGPDDRVNAYGQQLTWDLVGINADRGSHADELDSKQYLGPSGALFALRPSRMPRPLFPYSFFLYMEDVALWMKLRSLGEPIAFCPRARAMHRWSVHTGRQSAMKLYYVERNRLWLSRAVRGLPATVASLAFTALRYAAYSVPAAPPTAGAAAALGRALREGLFGEVPQDVRDYFSGVRIRPGDYAPLRDQLRNPVGA